MSTTPWQVIQSEAEAAFTGVGKFPLRAYSEFMPAPFVGIKPYRPDRHGATATFGCTDDTCLDISEYEQIHELTPGLARIADHVVMELGKLMRGEKHSLPKRLLTDNAAWPTELAQAAADKKLIDDPIGLVLSIALSLSQDDKGNNRWTLFGASHDGAAAPFWHGFAKDADPTHFDNVVAWLGGKPGARIYGDAPATLASRQLGTTPIEEVTTLVTFTPFAELPSAIRAAYLARKLTLLPCPATLVFFHHPGYATLAKDLSGAAQIPLLHLFQHVDGSCAIRIPQSGWLDEIDSATSHSHKDPHGSPIGVVRHHRWERVERDATTADLIPAGDGKLTDKISVALFSTDPDVLGLYDKPMARNAQIWTEDYRAVLDGPRANEEAIDRAAAIVDAGGRFGYRFVWPAMRAGTRELYWHVPLLAKPGDALALHENELHGYVAADVATAPRVMLTPRLLHRSAHLAAATQFARDRGRARHTTCHNARKLLEFCELLGAPLSASMARSLLHVGKATTLEAWLEALPAMAADRATGETLATALRASIDLKAPSNAGEPLVLQQLGTREFEEKIWRSISALSEGEFKQKENGDGITVNVGKTGGPAAKAAALKVAEKRDLEALGDHLHDRYRALIKAHDMVGVAECVDQAFTWDTDFAYPWMDGWAKNQRGDGHERNIVMMIPGKNRGEAVIMGDHYDTAYMEDVYDSDRGGDTLRAPASGADDNHSATTALLLAAEQLLPLSKAGKLERDVWLIHLTGEEFPADSLGARAVVQALVEKRLAFTAEDGSIRDVSGVRVVGAYVLDMIGHNTERDRDVFQIAPGEGAAAAQLAAHAQRATQRWNACAVDWNREHRRGLTRAARMPDGAVAPPPFAHLHMNGEVRVEWEPRSALYNTDGQVFSDCGIPVVLFMENYDISRTGYHDTLDTMANIDLDYCAALTAIAIESVASAACAP